MVIWVQSAILHSLQSESHTKQCIALHCNVDVEDEGMQNEVKCDISMYREVKWVGIGKGAKKKKRAPETSEKGKSYRKGKWTMSTGHMR